jgi:CheY-like chemotaxis protein/anti-sigma regulatory factor (Ser/Thr protein kinase)
MVRVLVVDDSPDQARLIAGLLQAEGFTAEIAESGEAAIESMAACTPDVVATDLIMPGLNGLEVVEEVQRRHPLVPVILMTAFGSGDIAARALQQGAASYVPKRRVHDELVPTIHDLLAVAETRREQERVLRAIERSEHRFVLENDPSLIPPLAAFVQERIRMRAEHFDETEWMHVGVALHEALINAMHHGNLEVRSELREAGGDVYREMIEQRLGQSPYRTRRVHVTVKLSRAEMACLIRDEGPGFAPEQVPDPTDPVNLERVSGRGLYLIWTFMDEVLHNDVGNEITLVKRLVAGERTDS